MKVTKLIREYVTESVEKAIPITNLCPEYEDAKNNASMICNILKDELYSFYENRLEELKVDYPIPDDFKIKNTGGISYSDWDSELRDRNYKLSDEARNERARKIKEILLSLELGANRDELNRMIESLVGDEGNKHE